MKRIFEMKGKLLAHYFAAILLGSASLVSIAHARDDAVVQTADGISYVSGGIGAESIEGLNARVGDFNLKLVFALKTGDYVSDVQVAIADAKGKTLLDTTSEGPWLLIKLPVGKYQIVATFAGNAIKRQVIIGAAKLRTVDFRWVSE